MNISKILFVCVWVGFLASCAPKVWGPEDFKNYTSAQLLKNGEKELAKHNFKESIKYFEAICALYPFEQEAKKGQLMSIYAYYKSDDYTSALAAAAHYLHLYPVGEHTDYAYYIKGLVNYDRDHSTWLQKIYYTMHSEKFDLSNLKEAFVDFETLIKLFPKSIYAKDAEKRMLHIRNLLIKREIQIAQFYFNRKAYVAAANRAADVVKYFRGASQTAEALKIMIKSYRALGESKQANNALRVLRLNFPKEQII